VGNFALFFSLFIDDEKSFVTKESAAAEPPPEPPEKLQSSDEASEDDVNEDMEMDRKEEAEKVRYPWQVVAILSTEACERFSYYGMSSKESFFI